jgi:hypothetical protein
MIDGAGRLLAAKQQIEHFLVAGNFNSKQVQDFFKKTSDTCVNIFNDIDALIPTKRLITFRRSADGSRIIGNLQTGLSGRINI